jgi:hypothetical protein
MATKKHWAFWMVYGMGQRNPAHEHTSEASAIEEAKRLSREVPGVQFFVLEAKRGYVLAPPPITDIEIDPDEVPF